MMDFRLTDPIHPEFLPEEFKERLRRWNEAKRKMRRLSRNNNNNSNNYNNSNRNCSSNRIVMLP